MTAIAVLGWLCAVVFFAFWVITAIGGSQKRERLERVIDRLCDKCVDLTSEVRHLTKQLSKQHASGRDLVSSVARTARRR